MEETCSKMRRVILWVNKQECGATVQSFKSLSGWSSIQAGGTWISWRLVKSFSERSSWNACTWHELDDLTFCGRSTSLRDQSENGLRHVTDDWQRWFLTFITHTISDNVFVWETRHSIADWVCFKTQNLLVILRTQNQIQDVFCVLFEVETLFLSVGYARNKLLSRTVLQSLKSFLWMLGYVWMGYLLLVFGTYSDWNLSFIQWQCPTNTYKHSGNWCYLFIPKPRPRKSERRQRVDQVSDVDYVPTNTHSSHTESQKRSLDKGGSWKTKSDDETRVQDPQSFSSLV